LRSAVRTRHAQDPTAQACTSSTGNPGRVSTGPTPVSGHGRPMRSDEPVKRCAATQAGPVCRWSGACDGGGRGRKAPPPSTRFRSPSRRVAIGGRSEGADRTSSKGGLHPASRREVRGLKHTVPVQDTADPTAVTGQRRRSFIGGRSSGVPRVRCVGSAGQQRRGAGVHATPAPSRPRVPTRSTHQRTDTPAFHCRGNPGSR
jgi:hypothetical protein